MGSCDGCDWKGAIKTCEQCTVNGREKNNNNSSVSSSHMEPDFSNAPLAEEKTKRLDSRCSINVHSKRHRLTDADGISAKGAIDSLRLAGILPDDSPQYVKAVTYSQEKTKGPEETIITIEWEGEMFQPKRARRAKLSLRVNAKHNPLSGKGERT